MRRIISGLLLVLALSPAVRAAGAPSSSDLLERARALEAGKQYDQAIGVYQEYLTARPGDDEARAALARLLSRQARYEEAVVLYSDILARHPDDSDVQVALARVLSWQGKLREARALYERALERESTNQEARRGLADTLYWAGDYVAALRLYEALYARTMDPEIAARMKAIKAVLAPSLPYRDYLKFGYGHFTYSGSLSDEREWLLEAAKPFGQQTVIARVEVVNRFKKLDAPISVYLHSSLWNGASGYLGIGGTPDADFSPEVYIAGEIFQGLGALYPSLSFAEPSFGFRWMSFPGEKVEIIIPGLTLYFPRDVWLTERAYYVPDAQTITVSSELNWQINPRLRLSGSAAFGRTADRFGALEDLRSTSSRIFRLGLTFPLAARLSAEIRGHYEDRKEFYARRGGTCRLIYHW